MNYDGGIDRREVILYLSLKLRLVIIECAGGGLYFLAVVFATAIICIMYIAYM